MLLLSASSSFAATRTQAWRRRSTFAPRAEGSRPDEPPPEGGHSDKQKERPQRLSGFAALGRALGRAPPAAGPSSAAHHVVAHEVPVVGAVYRNATVVKVVESAAGGLNVFVEFLDGYVGLLHDAGWMRIGGTVDVQLLAINAEGKYKLGLAPAASGKAPAKKKRRPPDAPAKEYKGLGVRTWEDLDALLAAGGWTLEAMKSLDRQSGD